MLGTIGGAVAYMFGFAEIAKGSWAASAMSYCWTTGACQGAIAAAQSAAATFANTVAAMTL